MDKPVYKSFKNSGLSCITLTIFSQENALSTSYATLYTVYPQLTKNNKMTVFISKEQLRSKRRVELLVSEWYDTTAEELNSHTRNQSVVIARYICFFLLKRDFGMSVSIIANVYKRDHSTVTHGLKKVKELGLWKEVRDIESYPHAVLPLTVV